MKEIRLYIFDWDGTLADSLATIVFSHQQAATELQIPMPEATRIKQLIGLSADEVVRRLYPGRNINDYSEIIRVYRQYYFQNANKIFLFPGVLVTLQQLFAEGHLLAIATGKSRQGLDAGLLDANIQKYFCITKTAEETASKPDPLMVHEILESTQIPAPLAIMIGDTEYDMQLAQNAGIKSAAVTFGAHSIAQLKPYNPLAYLSEMKGLLNLVW